MLIQEAIESLQNFTKSKITYENIGNILGISNQAVSNRIQRGSHLKDFEWEKLKEHYNYFDNSDYINNLASDYASSVVKNTEEYVNVDFYPDVFGSCGTGTFVLSEQKEKISVPKRNIEGFSPIKHYSVINAYGDSMMPYIQDKDELIVEHYDNEQIKDNRVYVFRLADKVFIKRLVLNINQIVIKSDNTMYEPIVIKGQELDDFEIIGKIVGLFRRMG